MPDDEDINYLIKHYPRLNITEFIYDDILFLYDRFFNKTISVENEKLILKNSNGTFTT